MPSSSFDNYDMGIKVGFACLNAPFVAFGILGIVALNRTRKTPETARFLSNGLIIQDIIAAGGFSLRKFMSNDTMNILVQVTSINGAFLAYLTVGMMALERMILFYAPNFYLRHPAKCIKKESGHAVLTVRTLDFQTTFQDICETNKDDWPSAFRSRLEIVSDLLAAAADAVYRQMCNINYRTNKAIPVYFHQRTPETKQDIHRKTKRR
ncbi:hypothetical protein DPMN_010708 [Dreissena polymorpha]|uniref:Uncharacterized protein n=1 Tax=Dreissena polymorpha TaxID=45954 RepID=A0A9D4S170_DREPO|nr:hypothetical protein DPMN_010708 [Dreissena polymorpha]